VCRCAEKRQRGAACARGDWRDREQFEQRRDMNGVKNGQKVQHGRYRPRLLRSYQLRSRDRCTASRRCARISYALWNDPRRTGAPSTAALTLVPLLTYTPYSCSEITNDMPCCNRKRIRNATQSTTAHCRGRFLPVASDSPAEPFRSVPSAYLVRSATGTGPPILCEGHLTPS